MAVSAYISLSLYEQTFWMYPHVPLKSSSINSRNFIFRWLTVTLFIALKGGVANVDSLFWKECRRTEYLSSLTGSENKPKIIFGIRNKVYFDASQQLNCLNCSINVNVSVIK